MDAQTAQLHTLGAIPIQRSYEANKKLDIGTKEISTAIRKANTPEAAKFADAIDRLKIKTSGSLTEEMTDLIDLNKLSIEARAGQQMFYGQIKGKKALGVGGMAKDSTGGFARQDKLDNDAWYNIFRTHQRPGKELNYDPDQLQAAIKTSRAASIKSQSGQLTPPEMIAGGNSTGPAKGANQDAGIIVHEAMHVMDFNGGNVRRTKNLIKPEMVDEAKKYGFSFYGISDVGGKYNEFTAEAGVYYVFDSKNFKKEAPTIYAMIDEIVTSAKRP